MAPAYRGSAGRRQPPPIRFQDGLRARYGLIGFHGRREDDCPSPVRVVDQFRQEGEGSDQRDGQHDYRHHQEVGRRSWSRTERDCAEYEREVRYGATGNCCFHFQFCARTTTRTPRGQR